MRRATVYLPQRRQDAETSRRPWRLLTFPPSVGTSFRTSLCAFAVITLLLPACSPPPPSHSPLFETLLINDSTLFRAASLGQHIDTVQKREAGQPRHEDLLGLSYAYPLPGGDSLIVEYYTDNLQASRQSNTVISVVNNILIEEEARATEVYEELQNYFQHRYGPSHGHYGEDHWTGELPAGRMEIRLILNPPGQGLTLNFLDLNING